MNPNKDKMDKRQVENLLKYGAYDLFNEQADKASERCARVRSSAWPAVPLPTLHALPGSFCEEDIDMILEKRARVVRQIVDVSTRPAGCLVASHSPSCSRCAGPNTTQTQNPDAASFSKATFRAANADSGVRACAALASLAAGAPKAHGAVRRTLTRQVDVMAPDFWEKLLPDETSGARMLARLRAGGRAGSHTRPWPMC
jgi:hypothetical protein